MFIYTVTRAFEHLGRVYKKDEVITEQEFQSVSIYQPFVKRVWSGTQAELEEYMKNSSTADTQEIDIVEQSEETNNRRGRPAKLQKQLEAQAEKLQKQLEAQAEDNSKQEV